MKNAVNTFFAFNKVQICFDQRSQFNLVRYFEALITNFEREVEKINGLFSVHAILNKAKMFKRKFKAAFF